MKSVEVLLIDGDETDRELFQWQARRRGWRLLHACSFEDARFLMLAFPSISLVYADVRVPVPGGGSAEEFVRRICPQAVVMGISSVPPKFMTARMRAMGVSGWMIKPLRW